MQFFNRPAASQSPETKRYLEALEAIADEIREQGKVEHHRQQNHFSVLDIEFGRSAVYEKIAAITAAALKGRPRMQLHLRH